MDWGDDSATNTYTVAPGQYQAIGTHTYTILTNANILRTIVVKTIDACNPLSVSDAITYVVTVKPLPNAAVSYVGTVTQCAVSSPQLAFTVTLNAAFNFPSTITWYWGTTPIGNTQSIVATQAGLYTAEVIYNGCSATYTAVTLSTVNCPTGGGAGNPNTNCTPLPTMNLTSMINGSNQGSSTLTTSATPTAIAWSLEPPGVGTIVSPASGNTSSIQ